jgi:Ca-activated chloride channel family protein
MGAAGSWRGQAKDGKLSFIPATGRAADAPPVPWRLALGLALIATALARPQWGPETRPTPQTGSEILIAIDLSRSMSAADVAPSRLERAKQVAADLINHLPGERVGLIVFSSVAVLQSPLSPDHDALLEFLPSLRIATGAAGGTRYEGLFRTAAEGFGSDPGAARDLILLSDGEAHDPDWERSLGLLTNRGIAVVALGLGTEAGATLPDGSGGVLRDSAGGVVVSRLEASHLARLAARTQGVFVDASAHFDAAQAGRALLARAASGRQDGPAGNALKERFQWFLAGAACLLAWSLGREFPVEIRSAGQNTRKRAAFGRSPAMATALVLLALLVTAAPARAQVDEDLSDTLGEQLHAIVAQLSARRPLRAADYSVLAGMTIGYGRWRRAAHHPLTEGIVLDGLAAVAAGRALDPRAADWATLQISLQALLKAPPAPPPPPPPPPQQQSLAHPPPPTPEELALLQKLIRVREQDSAVRLYELLNPPVVGAAAADDKNW